MLSSFNKKLGTNPTTATRDVAVAGAAAESVVVALEKEERGKGIEMKRRRWGERRKKGGVRMTCGSYHFLLFYV
jgi:GTP cyclohydrolase II